MIAKSHQVRVGEGSFNVFPSQPESAQALWSALPPDLRLALAKTAPRVAGKWENQLAGGRVVTSARYSAGRVAANISLIIPANALTINEPSYMAMVGNRRLEGRFATLTEAQSACDTALRADGYVLDGDTP